MMKLKLVNSNTAIVIAAFLGLLSFGVVAFNIGTRVLAAPVTGFTAGNIIDDITFTNSGSMSLSQIQNFLNAKGASCTSGNCLKNYSQNGRSAAQIIYEAAQFYRINPQTLIVLLQKETGLVTIDNPAAWRYQTATGYGCPDTAVCDTQYYGFYNQVNWAAKMFRAIMDNSPNWYAPYTVGNNRVYFNPNLGGCGSTVVNIVNRATAALYSYTPYQPNQAALNAGYGTGDACSSYGNRNFYLYFNDWFGSTHSSLFFQIDGRVYVDGANNSYYYVSSPSILTAYGLGINIHSIRNTNSSYLQGKASKGNLPLIARFDNPDIYAFDGGRIHHFQTEPDFLGYGYQFGQEAVLPASFSWLYTASTPMNDVLKQEGSTKVYAVSNGKKQHIATPTEFTTMGSPTYNTHPSVTMSKQFIDTIPESYPILANGSLVATTDTNQFGFWSNNTFHPVEQQIAKDWSIPVAYSDSSSLINLMPQSTSIGRLVKSNAGTLYLLDNKRKLTIDPSQLSNLGFTSANFQLVDDSLVDKFTTSSLTSLVQYEGTLPVYAIKDGASYHIYDEQDLVALGYSWPQLVRLKSGSMSLFQATSKTLFHEGKLVRVNNTPEVYLIDSGFKKHHIPTEMMMSHYGFKMSDVISIPQSELNGYTDATVLGRYIKVDNTYWLIDSGKKWKFPGSLALDTYDIPESAFSSLSNTILNEISQSDDLTSLIRADGKPEVYKIENGKKRWITTETALTNAGYQKSQIRVVSSDFASSFENGSNIN